MTMMTQWEEVDVKVYFRAKPSISNFSVAAGEIVGPVVKESRLDMNF
jgi:hypothetical protein